MITADLHVATRGRGFVELTAEVARHVRDSGIATGLCAASIRHTSASLLICENADPQVLRDLAHFMERLVPDGDPLFRHVAEGDDDMPAHVRSVLTHSDLCVPIRERRLLLGTWQGIYLWEHRLQAFRRDVALTLIGEG